MKKRIGILILTLGLMLSGLNVQASEKSNTFNFRKYYNSFLNEIKGSQDEESLSSLKDVINELIKNIEPEDAKEILQFVEKKIEDGNWETEQGIKDAIAEGEREFGVTLSDKHKELILSVITKIKSLGIDPKYLIEQTEKIYEKYTEEIKEDISEKRKEIAEETQNKIKEEVNKSLTDYFSNMLKNVKTFFQGIFGRQL